MTAKGERTSPRASSAWTPLGTTVRLLVGWLVLLMIFSPGRVCEPLFSQQCASQAWNYVGDAVWLRNLYAWQTLATGLIALVAAAIGAWFVHQQIVLERERRRRVSASVRAMMPHTLAGLIDYLDECSAALRASINGASHTMPRIPPDIISQIQKIVEVSEDAVATQVSALLGDLQVLDSRLSHLAKQPNKQNAQDFAINAMAAHAAASLLFPYARKETDDLPSARMIASQYMSSLKLMGFNENNHKNIFNAASVKAAKIIGEPTP